MHANSEDFQVLAITTMVSSFVAEWNDLNIELHHEWKSMPLRPLSMHSEQSSDKAHGQLLKFKINISEQAAFVNGRKENLPSDETACSCFQTVIFVLRSTQHFATNAITKAHTCAAGIAAHTPFSFNASGKVSKNTSVQTGSA